MVEEARVPNTPLFNIKAHLPVSESFGKYIKYTDHPVFLEHFNSL